MKAGYLISAAALFTLAAAASSLGDDGGRGCSNASLYGRYGLATHGERIGVYDASGVIHLYTYNGNPAPVRVDQVTNETFDGHGNATQFEYVFANGSSQTPSGFVGPATGTYQVNSDCSGSETLTYSSGFEINRVFVLSNGGRTIHILTTGIHPPSLPIGPSTGVDSASAGVDCSNGCDLAVQFYTDGERY
jgi:hypothetical protein